MYINYRYPFGGAAATLATFPVPRDENPVGSYQVEFSLPPDWNGRRILLQLDGADSNATVWVDGHEVGYSQDSRLPAEFDVTAACATTASDSDVAGPHILSIQCMRFCDGSYLEDQDQWWLSGLHRHVRLMAKPRALSIVDYHFETVAVTPTEDDPTVGDATLRIEARCTGQSFALDGYRLVASLHGPCLVMPGQPTSAAPCLWREESHLRPHQPTEDDLVAVQQCAQFGSELIDAGGLLTGEAAASFTLRLAALRLWSAEAPWLYSLVVELHDDALGAMVDCESCRVGVRRVSLRDGLLCLNSAPLTVRGVNRHEHCPRRGKAVEWAAMLEDARLMKAASLNAVRASHYPCASDWYELCDAVGLYVVDEANIETHGCLVTGDEGRLAKTRSWRRAFVERFSRMVQRDKNHACVVIWSLGNEAGYGEHHDAMAAWCRAHEPSRVLQYESCGGAACTDILCPMYPSFGTVERLNTLVGQLSSSLRNGSIEPTRPYPRSTHAGGMRPVIVCEYAHSMGNSTGNLREWWELFDRLPYCQGGFIWDWVDQGLKQPVPTRIVSKSSGAADDDEPAPASRDTRWAYGGDFGERVHDARFCINGLLGPDRRPHPALHEVKRVLQPVKSTVTDWQYKPLHRIRSADPCLRVTGSVQVRNLHNFRSLAGLQPSVKLDVNGSTVARVEVAPLDGLRPQATQTFEVQFALTAQQLEPVYHGHTIGLLQKSEAFVTVQFVDANPPSWAHSLASVVATSQCPVQPPPPSLDVLPSQPIDTDENELSGLRCVDEEDRIVVRGMCGRHPHLDATDFELVVRKCDATIGPMRIGGQTILEGTSGTLGLWRAPTENDRGCTFVSVPTPKEELIASLVWWYRILIFILRMLPPWIFPHGYSHASLWERDGLHQLHRCRNDARVVHASSERVVMLTCCELRAPGSGARRAEHSMRITVLRNGTVHLANEANITTAHSESLARVGLDFQLPLQPQDGVRWYGRGPHENYADRQEAADIGIHEETVSALAEELTSGYVYPQECGRRGATRWLALSCGVTSRGGGLLVCGGTPFSFTLLPHKHSSVAAASHPHALTGTEAAANASGGSQGANLKYAHYLCVDRAAMGVGGDTSWIRSVYPRYHVYPGLHRWSVVLRPFDAWPPAQSQTLPDDLQADDARAPWVPLSTWRKIALFFGTGGTPTGHCILLAMLAVLLSFGASTGTAVDK